jgi:hypothetical protein
MGRAWSGLLILYTFSLLFFIAGCGREGIPDDEATLALKKVYSWKTNEDFFALTNCFIYDSAYSNDRMNGIIELGKIWVQVTRMGTVEKVEILKKLNDGNTANVIYNLYFRDGTTAQSNTALLIKTDGIWKLTVY